MDKKARNGKINGCCQKEYIKAPTKDFMEAQPQRSEQQVRQLPDSQFTRRGGWREWTEDYVKQLSQISSGDGFLRIANAHNAALVEDVRLRSKKMQDVISDNVALRIQLVVEREKAKPLVELCDEVAAWHRDKDSPDYNECDTAPCAWCDALAKVKP